MLLYSQTPPEDAFIHTAEMTAMKERGYKMGNIYRLIELNAGHLNNRENRPILEIRYMTY